MLQLRAYEAHDYDLVSSWWKASGREPVKPCLLTDFGVIVTIDSLEISCAWFYIDNRPGVARVEHFIARPDALPLEIEASQTALFTVFSGRAAECGKLLHFERPFERFEDLCLTSSRSENLIDHMEAAMEELPPGEVPLIHRFAPGIYSREIFIPAGTILTSKLHRTEHPYMVSKGDVSVWTKEDGLQRFKAPHQGVTKPGTRRVFLAHEDTVWTTFHATDETDPEKIEAAIIEPHKNPLLKGSNQCLL